MNAIVAVDNNWGIGSNNKLLVSIPEDMRFFKEKTTNSIVVMGRKTYDSLPVKPLPNRINVVITSKVKEFEIDKNGTIFMAMHCFKNFLHMLSYLSPIDYYIIGGGQIYRDLLPYCNTVYVTKINHSYNNADTFFPNLDKDEDWEELESDNEEKIYRDIKYKFCVYKRV